MKHLFFGFLLLNGYCDFAQVSINKLINAKEVERVEKILSADSMMGRRTFTPGIEKAATFISNKFKAIGLETWNNSGSYLQNFVMVRPKFL
jgi:hypothetical protein